MGKTHLESLKELMQEDNLEPILNKVSFEQYRQIQILSNELLGILKTDS